MRLSGSICKAGEKALHENAHTHHSRNIGTFLRSGEPVGYHSKKHFHTFAPPTHSKCLSPPVLLRRGMALMYFVKMELLVDSNRSTTLHASSENASSEPARKAGWKRDHEETPPWQGGFDPPHLGHRLEGLLTCSDPRPLWLCSISITLGKQKISEQERNDTPPCKFLG